MAAAPCCLPVRAFFIRLVPRIEACLVALQQYGHVIILYAEGAGQRNVKPAAGAQRLHSPHLRGSTDTVGAAAVRLARHDNTRQAKQLLQLHVLQAAHQQPPGSRLHYAAVLLECVWQVEAHPAALLLLLHLHTPTAPATPAASKRLQAQGRRVATERHWRTTDAVISSSTQCCVVCHVCLFLVQVSWIWRCRSCCSCACCRCCCCRCCCW
ncbi:hypothetical protein COO60DRAFT_1535086 [Scenedesmus sp. NREL 46B-D3]|nr:hypothetical protein COO60DRAFT_1535086 [Scenedesmus sp. NREL 46B-D3]